MKTKNTFSFAFLAGFGLLLALQGCSDDEDANPKPPVIEPEGGSGGTSSTGGKAGGAGKTGGGTDNKGGDENTGNVGGGDPDPGGGAGGEPNQPECTLDELGADGCFNCPKNGVVEQWLNRCLDTECEPFDNGRLPQLEDDGSLPDLP